MTQRTVKDHFQYFSIQNCLPVEKCAIFLKFCFLKETNYTLSEAHATCVRSTKTAESTMAEQDLLIFYFLSMFTKISDVFGSLRHQLCRIVLSTR